MWPLLPCTFCTSLLRELILSLLENFAFHYGNNYFMLKHHCICEITLTWLCWIVLLMLLDMVTSVSLRVIHVVFKIRTLAWRFLVLCHFGLDACCGWTTLSSTMTWPLPSWIRSAMIINGRRHSFSEGGGGGSFNLCSSQHHTLNCLQLGQLPVVWMLEELGGGGWTEWGTPSMQLSEGYHLCRGETFR